MKKILLFVLVLVILVIVVIVFSFNSIVEKGVERYGSLATGTGVSMKDADISLFSGKGSIKGLIIGNPEGFQTEHAFSINEARVTMNVKSVFTDRLKINEIYIDSPVVTYEKAKSTDNIKEILGNVEKFAGSTDEEAGKEEDVTSGEKEQKVEIDSFIMKNGKVNMSASVLKGKEVSLEMPDMHLKNIGKEGEGTSVSRVMEIIFARVNRNIDAAVTGSAGDIKESLEKEMEKKTGDTVDRLKDMLGE